MREADVILFIVDAQQGLTPVDQELARLLRRSKRPVVLVVNKIDHPKHEDLDLEFQRLGFESVSTEIEVRVANGEVTLEGTVEDRRTKRMAEDIIETCPGVKQVHNRIRVQGNDNDREKSFEKSSSSSGQSSTGSSSSRSTKS